MAEAEWYVVVSERTHVPGGEPPRYVEHVFSDEEAAVRFAKSVAPCPPGICRREPRPVGPSEPAVARLEKKCMDAIHEYVVESGDLSRVQITLSRTSVRLSYVLLVLREIDKDAAERVREAWDKAAHDNGL